MLEVRAMRRWVLPVLLLVGAAVLPHPVCALAGLAEHDRSYTFNRFAHLVAVSPGDICEGGDKYCILLVRVDGRRYEGTDGTLEAVNVPGDAGSPYVLARRSRDDAWLVFDLGTDTIIAESADMDDVLAVWEELGQSPPELMQTRTVAGHLKETRDSVVFRWGIQIVFLAMGALIPSLLLLVIFRGIARAFKRGHHDTGSRVRLVLAQAFMVPAVIAGIVAALCVTVLVTVWVLSVL